MKRVSVLVLGLLALGSWIGSITPEGVGLSSVYAQESLRPEVGKPLQAAQELMKAQKYKEALAKIREADAVSGKTAYENYILDRMRGSAASGAGETELAAKSFEAVINSGKLPEAEQVKLMEAVAGTYYRAKEYGKAAAWAHRYFKGGGSSASMRTLLMQAQYLNGEYAEAAKAINDAVAADEKAGRTPSEEQLQLLANCYLKLNDKTGYANALEKLVVHHPKKEYWADLLARIQRKPGFSDRLSLDVYRLMFATGNLREGGDFMEMAQLALQAGLPAEAKKIVADGFAKGVLGSGAEADRHKRLRDLANKQTDDDRKGLAEDEKTAASAKEGEALVKVGYAFVTNGDLDKGIAMMEQGIAKGGLKRAEDAKLHLGMAYLQAGNRAKAVQVLRSVGGADGAADLARLWIAQGGRQG
jgi:Tfp pilus assembly protein PilF